MRRRAALACIAIAALMAIGARGAALAREAPPSGDSTRPVTIGSKRFTESWVLAEIAKQRLERAGIAARHRPGLGNTAIVFEALKAGAIDLYPEYTGTIARELLGLSGAVDEATLHGRLADLGLAIDIPLGFSNTYALAMTEARAAALGVRTLSDLARHPDLRIALSHEFLGRADGWPALVRGYGLAARPSGIEHALAFDAIADGRVDVTDVYTTDAKIGRLGLRVLADDRRVFPRYDAVLLHRADLEVRHPGVLAALAPLARTIDERRMIALNAAAEIEGRTFAEAAARYFGNDAERAKSERSSGRSLRALLSDREFARMTREHLVLTAGAVLAAAAIGIPLGVVAWRLPRLAVPVLGLAGVLQTVPSLALLALLVAALGQIGIVPALVALFLYALLPIVTNTHAGLAAVPSGLLQAAVALGLTPRQVLRAVALPLAWPLVLAGVQTAAVIAVGTATIAAFVGAGGYGERIASGLALNDATMLVAGAVPAAVLALLVQGAFAVARRASRAERARRAAREHAAG